jgi:hypothetical protein
MTWYLWRLNGGAVYLRKIPEKDGEKRGVWETCFVSAPSWKKTDRYGGPEEGDAPRLPCSSVWGEGESALLRPCLSAAPYLLKLRPGESVKIAPEGEARFTVSLPPLVRLELDGLVLGEAMPLAPPKTWFGPDTMSGCFCHCLEGGLRPGEDAPEPEPSAFVRCGLRVRNRSKTVFALERFLLCPAPLAVYERGGILVSDSVDFEFFGPDADGKTTVRPLDGAGNADCRLLSPGVKTGAGELFARQSVAIIRFAVEPFGNVFS